MKVPLSLYLRNWLLQDLSTGEGIIGTGPVADVQRAARLSGTEQEPSVRGWEGSRAHSRKAPGVIGCPPSRQEASPMTQNPAGSLEGGAATGGRVQPLRWGGGQNSSL